MIKVSIVEDIDDVRQGLKFLIDADPEIKVIRTHRSAEEFINSWPIMDVPDILLMDIGLPGINGIEATEIVKKKYPEIEILILTIFEEEEKILNAIQAGATGYILKNTKPGDLVSQIKSIHTGGSPISPNIARKILDEFRRGNKVVEKRDYNLTPREKEILRAIVDGLTYREISKKYGIASSTVKKHILHIYRKLRVNSKVEFIKKVLDEHLI